MIVKRYVVKDMPEALTKIRQDLGHDAVILSSKKIKQRGLFGLFSVTQLEVVAAVNDKEPQIAEKKKEGKQPLVQPSNTVNSSEPGPQNERNHIKQPEPGVHQNSDAQVLKEVQELRGILAKFLHQSSEILPAPIQKIRSELVANDVSPEFAERLILNMVKENEEIHLLNEQEFRHLLTDLISKEINDILLPSPLASDSRIVAFVGPTGVGKTTTIAKVAAEELLKNRRRVGLITADTYRIAAVEQLKTYANILQIPVEVVFTTEEVEQAIEKMKDRDLILIDTAGRNYGDLVFVEHLNQFLQASRPDETCLVLSLTTKSTDLEHIVANFEGVAIDKFIFTKLDETTSYGAIYNLTHRFKKPLAYLTTGQNVPDDIEVATPERIARLVVGEKQYV
ncbi:flagellar biosynthesis protein FlhF [Effusibacillus consociatus]|uniref:Flagellar biosynthesis protein FlhF n=1 Tax=Effusibacillus consociatus TaxID=1117041 RepID=A0ABV9Q4T4_9BACL